MRFSRDQWEQVIQNIILSGFNVPTAEPPWERAAASLSRAGMVNPLVVQDAQGTVTNGSGYVILEDGVAIKVKFVVQGRDIRISWTG